MKVSQIMTKEVLTVGLETGIEEVAGLLVNNRIHGVPVVNEDFEVLGIITETDLFSKNSENLYLPQYISLLKDIDISEVDSRKQRKYWKKIQQATAKDIMTSDCICLNEDSLIADALKIFKEKKFNMLPVVDNKNILKGVVSLADLIKLIN